ncbi:3-hydroxyacyl-CoA dehydrogenase type-2-like [Cylas formicarius]|uniref:3-hydroxyacyl-CoA dehydrogenase type-2-like n=1 Tax=Cylas formicarius TaxID=197179 RepID=UPI00295849A3|nr:3-hydroxyacyl-CoA dehydrogenase type-2-like [Cylas formicarius]XP_060517818.1 3-hydroxyacyl-CoA dehydrogenase type-2-like [Cylas formicarius]
MESVYLVTGGSSGLGEAIVHALLDDGSRVAILDIEPPISTDLDKHRTNVIYIKTDITSEDEVLAALTMVKTRFGKLSGVINSAGIFAHASIYNFETNCPHSLELFNRVLQVNLTGTFNVIRLALTLLMQNEINNIGEKGVIINISSIGGLDGRPGNIAYTISKAAMSGMTSALAKELASQCIRVVDIAPGFFHTPMTENVAPESINFQFPNRGGRPEELAEFVKVVLTTPMLNGCTLRFDAGQSV